MDKDSAAPLDLVVQGGRVLDPSQNLDARMDVGVRLGRIVDVAPDLSARVVAPKLDYPPSLGTSVVHADGMIVVPGLIDMHAHVYTGVCPLTVPADDTSADAGVTTVVSAGDAGANTIEGFRRLVVDQSRTRVLAFLHISTIGLAGWPEGEAHDLSYLDVQKAARAVAENRDFVVGIKVREQAPLIVGENGLEPVRRAVAAGEEAGVPVMVHIGGAPVGLAEVLDVLRPGDIITHCYTPAPNGLVEDGRVIAAAHAARERGIVFDVGHGFGSFGYETVAPAVAEGFWPDTISTDLHSLSASGPVVDLPTTMSKFLNVGMSLSDVVRATTMNPARVIGRADTVGSLRIGSIADVAVLAVEDRDVQFRDATGAVRSGSRILRVHSTIRAGIPWRRPAPHPGPTGGSRTWLDALASG